MKKKINQKNPRRKYYIIISVILVILSFIGFISSKRSTTSGAFVTIAFILSFYVIDEILNLKFRKVHYIFILIIGIGSLFLSPLFFLIPNYDKPQHFFFPILLASMIFYLASKTKLNIRWRLAMVFFIVIGTIGLFEVGEYLGDLLFDLKLQGVFLKASFTSDDFIIIQSRIDDTMIDLLLGMAGTVSYIILTLSHKTLRVLTPH